MKHHQRLDHGRLAEVLHERGIANVDAIRELLQQSREGGMPFCEALVTTNLVPDWDLSRIVCETFSLPFLPIDMVEPNAKLRTELDMKLFRQHQVVPFDRFGQVLTVIMPALVQADVLAMLAAASDLVILPVVGTVETNRRWILENLGAGKAAEIEGGWGNLFDQADAEVNASLGGLFSSEPAQAAEAPREDFGFDLDATVAPLGDDDKLDLDAISGLSELGNLGALDVDPLDGLLDDDDEHHPKPGAAPAQRTSAPPPSGDLDLPPMPEFGSKRAAS